MVADVNRTFSKLESRTERIVAVVRGGAGAGELCCLGQRNWGAHLRGNYRNCDLVLPRHRAVGVLRAVIGCRQDDLDVVHIDGFVTWMGHEPGRGDQYAYHE